MRTLLMICSSQICQDVKRVAPYILSARSRVLIVAGWVDSIVLEGVSCDYGRDWDTYDLSSRDLARDSRVHGAKTCRLALSLTCATCIDDS